MILLGMFLSTWVITAIGLLADHFMSKPVQEAPRSVPLARAATISLVVAFVLTFGHRAHAHFTAGRLLQANAGWWCETDHRANGPQNPPEKRISCFELRYSVTTGDVAVSGLSWDRFSATPDATWKLSNIVALKPDSTEFVYYYDGYRNSRPSSAGLTRVTFSSRTGHYFSSTYGRVDVALRTVSEMENVLAIDTGHSSHTRDCVDRIVSAHFNP